MSSTMHAISEPMTLLTDLVLGCFALTLSLRLRRLTDGLDRYAAMWWSVALLASGMAALVGGVWHGFIAWFTPLVAWILWRITVWSVGVGSCAMLLGTIQARVPFRQRRLFRGLAIGEFLLYAVWMIFHHEFVWVIADYGSAMLLVLALHGWGWWRTRAAGDGWIALGVVVSVFAAAVQALELAPHPRFNHNDLYHVIQMVALWCFFRGACVLPDFDTAKGP
jgi:hypothetical protein